jgi:hypothetical protein
VHLWTIITENNEQKGMAMAFYHAVPLWHHGITQAMARGSAGNSFITKRAVAGT